MKRFELKVNGFDNSGAYELYPMINATKVIHSNEIFKNSFFREFMPENVELNGMKFQYMAEWGAPLEPHVFCDMYDWIEFSPRGMMFPISDKFKNLLEKFNLHDVRFHKGSACYGDQEVLLNVMHIKDYRYDCIDFEKSTFCFGTYHSGKKKDLVVQGSNMEEVEHNLGSKLVFFERAVMKPSFREIDMIFLFQHLVLVSERLKNAIEEAGLIGVKFVECPVNFEYSDEV